MTQSGIEPRSPGPLANTLPTRPMSWLKDKYIKSLTSCFFHRRLIQNRFSTLRAPRQHDLLILLTALLDWLTSNSSGLKTSVVIYLSDTHTVFLPAPHLSNSSYAIHIAFPLFLAYLKTQLHIQFSKSMQTGLSKVNMQCGCNNATGQQVSSGFQDSSQYSGQSQQCCSLSGFYLSPDVQIPVFPFKASEDHSRSITYNWYHHNLHVLPLSYFSGKV